MPIKQETNFDLNQSGNFARMQLNGANKATVQVSLLTDATPSAFILTIQRSNDGENFAALGTPETIAFGAFASAGSVLSSAIDCSGFDWLRVVVTTAEGAALEARVTLFAERTY